MGEREARRDLFQDPKVKRNLCAERPPSFGEERGNHAGNRVSLGMVGGANPGICLPVPWWPYYPGVYAQYPFLGTPYVLPVSVARLCTGRV